MKASVGICLSLLITFCSGAVLQTNKNNAGPITTALTYFGEYGNKKYYVESNPVTWETGQSLCQGQSMVALSIESQDELAYLDGAFPDPRISYWTSGQALPQPKPEEHYWTNVQDWRDYVRFNFNLNYNSLSYLPPRRPLCLAIGQSTSSNPGYFESVLCSELKPALCQLTS